MARTLIVSILHVSDATAEKLREKHGLDAEAVRAQVEGVGNLPFRWNVHPEKGSRAYIWTVVDDEPIQVVLYPSRSGDAEEWHLGSAYPEDPPE